MHNNNNNNTYLKGLITGLLFSMCLIFFTSFVSTNRVQPVCFVKPSIGGFVPVNGSSIGNTWSMNEVVPMCQVKPSIGGFVPVNGSSIGNTWSR